MKKAVGAPAKDTMHSLGFYVFLYGTIVAVWGVVVVFGG